MSQTMAVDAKVQRLKAEGIDVVDFGAGQPDFPTPERIRAAGIAAIEAGKTRYTPAQGTVSLRETIAAQAGASRGGGYGPDDVVVANGAKQALFTALASLCDPGDEVLIPTPCWVTYPEQLVMLGAVPRYIPSRAEEGYRLTPAALEAAITPASKCLILNTPNNPTGAVYGREDLRGLGEVIRRRGLWLVTDEIYERMVFDGREHVSPVAADPALVERTAVVSGVSKSFAMTGWRIGYMIAPRDWADAATALQSHMTGNACSISQAAAEVALKGSRDESVRMTEIFQRRRDVTMAGLEEVPGCRAFKPEGTFYVLADLSAYLGRSFRGRAMTTAFDLVDHLLDEARVAVVPGDPFHAPGHVRLSFATDEETLVRGTARIAEALKKPA